MESKITAKGQMTLPKEARQYLRVGPGDSVRIFIHPDGHLALLPVIPVTALRGIAKSRLSRPVTLEEMDEAIAAGAIGSLLVVPYLHGSDLCLFSAAAWIVWEERTVLTWRVPIAAGWLVSTPYVNSTGLGLRLNRWTLFEVALLLALAVAAYWPGREAARPLASA